MIPAVTTTTSVVLTHPLVKDQRFLTAALHLARAADHLNSAERIVSEANDDRATSEIVSAIDTVNDVAALMLWRAARETPDG